MGAYLFRRRMIRSGVLARATILLGTRSFISPAMDFSLAEGTLVEPPDGAPGSTDGSDMAMKGVD